MSSRIFLYLLLNTALLASDSGFLIDFQGESGSIFYQEDIDLPLIEDLLERLFPVLNEDIRNETFTHREQFYSQERKLQLRSKHLTHPYPSTLAFTNWEIAGRPLLLPADYSELIDQNYLVIRVKYYLPEGWIKEWWIKEFGEHPGYYLMVFVIEKESGQWKITSFGENPYIEVDYPTDEDLLDLVSSWEQVRFRPSYTPMAAGATPQHAIETLGKRGIFNLTGWITKKTEHINEELVLIEMRHGEGEHWKEGEKWDLDPVLIFCLLKDPYYDRFPWRPIAFFEQGIFPSTPNNESELATMVGRFRDYVLSRKRWPNSMPIRIYEQIKYENGD